MGWINIVGWLTLVTTEAVFGGRISYIVEAAQFANYGKPNSSLPRWWLARTSPWCSPSGIRTCTSWPSRSSPSASTSSAIDFWAGGTKELVRKHPLFKDRCLLTYMAVFWSITAWISTSAVILATAPKTDAEFVFTDFTNETGWPDGVAWMLGLLQSAVLFLRPVIVTTTLLMAFAVCLLLLERTPC